MITIGTAGHIDHGKSSLVKALTSIDPDRLPEEKERGMTLDLGFAYLELPGGQKVGVVDVPGHQQFVHNVIPGLTGIDAVLLVVAADDGWMPQTEEHLRILDLLGIRRGIVVLNKIDTVADSGFIDLVAEDIKAHLAGSSLCGAQIVQVSARTGQGMEELKMVIAGMTGEISSRKDIGRPRLPIDRVFLIKGSGVVITGTLGQGGLSTGDEVTVLPKHLETRIRALESYKEHLDLAVAGSRVAANLAGVEKESLGRGDVIVLRGQEPPLSRYVHVELELLNNAPPLKTDSELTIFFETSELTARVILMERRVLLPGERGLAELRFSGEVSAVIGARFIARRDSPAMTVGGGVMLDPVAERFKVKEAPALMARLKQRRDMVPQDIVATEVAKAGYCEKKGFLMHSLLAEKEIESAITDLTKAGVLVARGGYLVATEVWKVAVDSLTTELAAFHRAEPDKPGLSQAELESRLHLPLVVFRLALNELASTRVIKKEEEAISLTGHRPRLSENQAVLALRVVARVRQDAQNPPSRTELLLAVPGADKVLYYLLQGGQLMELPDGIIMVMEDYLSLKNKAIGVLKSKNELTIQDISSLAGFSRKYSIPFLTQLDRQGITRREGNRRVAVRQL